MKHPIKCFITDDEGHATDTVKQYVAQTPFLQLVGVATNGIDTLDFLGKKEVDLLFLDVQMPGLSGLDILSITEIPVILTTAYREYAVDGFDHGVVDYLLKPFGYQRFLKAVQKAVVLLNKPSANQTPVTNEKDYFFIKGDRGVQLKINHSDIDYVEGAKNYVYFHCGKTKHMVKMALKDVETLLPQDLFARTHNSFIVAIKKITSINGSEVILNGVPTACTHIPISLGFRTQFMKKIER